MLSTNQTEALIYREIALRVPIKSRIIISTPPGSPFQPWDWRSRQLLVSHGCAAEVYRVEPWAVWVWNWGAIGETDFCDLRGEVDVAKWAAIINFRRSYHGGRHSRRDSDISKKPLISPFILRLSSFSFPLFWVSFDMKVYWESEIVHARH